MSRRRREPVTSLLAIGRAFLGEWAVLAAGLAAAPAVATGTALTARTVARGSQDEREEREHDSSAAV
ncbi:hypothetical protein [Streptomyces sp. NBC_01235]|uniref:hypothetical protein n=1 Tax=Streptomyces sp. NBC_01235 TaxID=2903788 RepID=UPI002E12CC4C|nr:hypothetical protein OG289_21890 [Streptomyces sp. NBC_01235]